MGAHAAGCINRRRFLAGTAAAALGLSGCLSGAPAWRTSSADRARAPRKVVVIGAGLAGLAAGYELLQAGHDVTIVEARERPGGLVHTVRGLFSDDLYAEAGATFIPDIHHLTLSYIRLANLPLVPVPPRAGGKLYFVRGRALRVASGASVIWPFDLTLEEERLGLGGLLKKYVFDALHELGDVTAPGWPGDPRVQAYDRMTGAEFLQSRGASPGALQLLRIGYLDLLGDGLESYSALVMLRDVAMQKDEKQAYTIAGGTDRLPRALASMMAPAIRYETPVVRIEPGERSAGVVVRSGAGHERLGADRVICTVPFSVLRGIEVSPPFSPRKQAAIAQLPYTSIARIWLQTSRKFWMDGGLPSSATTDLPIKHIFEPTVTQPGPRGILACDTAGIQARRLTAMKEDRRVEVALEEMARVHPELRRHFERGASKCWDEDEWARGAYAWFRPGQMLSLLPDIARPEGCVHFAGEHTSAWVGWMQGALESGVRAAREISEN